MSFIGLPSDVTILLLRRYLDFSLKWIALIDHDIIFFKVPNRAILLIWSQQIKSAFLANYHQNRTNFYDRITMFYSTRYNLIDFIVLLYYNLDWLAKHYFTCFKSEIFNTVCWNKKLESLVFAIVEFF